MPWRLAFVSNALLAAAVLCLGAGGCQRAPEGRLKVLVIGDRQPTLGDPLRPPADEAEAVLRASIAQGLVRFDAGGQIEPGLAERWNVSDDGLSYIFRLAEGEWHDGRKVNARDIARILTREIRAAPDDPVRDTLGAVDEVVAMTDRVIEIRLRAPRPNLLTLLAQPQFALIRSGAGTGPFLPQPPKAGAPAAKGKPLLLRRQLPGYDGEEGEREEVSLAAAPADQAIAAFRAQQAEVVLGGTVADLPLAQRAKLGRGELRFDPVAGLFGLAPVAGSAVAGDAQLRRILNQAIDRGALIATLDVPGLVPRATILQQGLAGIGSPLQPAWLGEPVEQRRAALFADAVRIRAAVAPRGGGKGAAPAPGPLPAVAAVAQPTIALDLPDGPGGDLILARLMADWGALGFTVTRAGKGERADFRLIDAVAPSDSPAWFVRRFRCREAPVCLPELEPLLAGARETSDARQRAALLAEAAMKMDAAQLFLPIAAPIRWVLVARSAPGFVENRYARHPLGDIAARTRRGTSP